MDNEDIVRYPWGHGITICTQNRHHFFGHIKNQEMQLSEIGILAEKFWYEIPNHFSMIELGNFVVMPNHVHGILIIDKPNDDSFVETRQCLVSTKYIFLNITYFFYTDHQPQIMRW